MQVMAIDTRVKSVSTGEYGAVLDAKPPIWNGEKTEVEYLITWDLDARDGDEPGWCWDSDLTAV